MEPGIVIAVISGVFSLLGVIITNAVSNRKMISEMQNHRAEYETKVDMKLEALTKQVEKHNTIVERTYALEKDVALLKQTVKE